MYCEKHFPLKAEFSFKSFFFNSLCRQCFVTSRIFKNIKIFLAYRFVMMAYTVITLGISFKGFDFSLGPRRIWIAWLTNWSYLVVCLYFILAFGILLHYFFTKKSKPQLEISQKNDNKKFQSKNTTMAIRRNSKDCKTTPKSLLNFWYRLDWILFGGGCTVSLLVTLVYFVVLFPQKNINFLPPVDIIMHLLNSVIMIIDFIICLLPIRIYHIFYIIFFSLAYIVFSFIYWLVDPVNNYIYVGLLDWNKPVTTLITSVVLIFIVMPIIHLVYFGAYKLKLFILAKLSD